MILKELNNIQTLSEAAIPAYSTVFEWLLDNEDDNHACAEYLAKLAGFEALAKDLAFIAADNEKKECLAYASGQYVYAFGPTRTMFDNCAVEDSAFSFAKIRRGNWELIEDAPEDLIEKTESSNFAQTLSLLCRKVA